MEGFKQIPHKIKIQNKNIFRTHLYTVGAERVNMGVIYEVDAVQVNDAEVRCSRLQLVYVDDLVDFLFFFLHFFIGT